MTQLFPRKPGPSQSLQCKARAAAHRVLDRAVAGDISAWDRVDWALRVTGDLPDSREPVSAWGLQVRREKESLHE